MLLLPRRSGPLEKSIPNQLAPTSLGLGAGAWTFPASWSQIVASSPYPFLLCGVTEIAHGTWSASVDGSYETIAQIGTGAAASEVLKAEFVRKYTINYTHVAGALVFVQHSEFHRVPVPLLIPTATRIAGRRANKLNTVDMGMFVYLMGYDASAGFPPVTWPYGYDPMAFTQHRGSLSSNVAPRVLPSVANGVTVTAHASTQWAMGSWVTLIAAGARTQPYLLTHIGVSRETGSNVGVHFECRIGLGSTPEEVGMIMIPGRASSYSPGPGVIELVRPILVYPGEDLKVAIGSSPASSYTLELHGVISEF